MSFIKTPTKGNDTSDLGLPAEHVALNNINFTRGSDSRVIGRPRASSLYKTCIRMHVLGTKSKTVKTEHVPFYNRLTFSIGDAVHHWVQNTDMLFKGHQRYGYWSCLACGKVTHFGAAPTVKCRHCGARKEAIVYYEYPLDVNGRYSFTGHPDLFLHNPKWSRLRVLDIKTIAGDGFDKLAAPLIEHVWQVNTYILGCNLDSTFPAKVGGIGYVVYISKRQFRKQLPVKMFPVKADKLTIDRIKAKLLVYKNGLKGYPNNLPSPIDTCANTQFNSYVSRTCPCRARCSNFFVDGR